MMNKQRKISIPGCPVNKNTPDLRFKGPKILRNDLCADRRYSINQKSASVRQNLSIKPVIPIVYDKPQN